LVEDHGLLTSKELIAEKLLRISEEDLRYLNAIRRRGKISTDPSIKLSTIHRMKGGEDDNIVLLDDMGYLPYKNYVEGNPDDEHRVFYTAVTRTRQNLHIVQTGSKHRYPL
jgi:superfamily I DNA/RNA helicase